MEFVRTELGTDPIIVEGYFAASPATVFHAWTDPNVVMKWFGRAPKSLHSAAIDLRQGGAWQFLESADDVKSIGFEGEYLVIESDERLVFTWSKFITQASGDREITPPSGVEVTFKANGKGTDVRLVHSAIHSKEVRKGFGGGWEFAFGTMTALLSNEVAAS